MTLRAKYFPKYKMIQFKDGSYLLLERHSQYPWVWTYPRTWGHCTGMMCWLSNLDWTSTKEYGSATMLDAIKKFLQVQQELGLSKDPEAYTVLKQWANLKDLIEELEDENTNL